MKSEDVGKFVCSTLGSGAFSTFLLSVGTIGGDASSGLVVGMGSTRLSCYAMSRSAFRTGSPARRLGVVLEGGLVSKVTMSVAACFKWSVSVTCGIGIL